MSEVKDNSAEEVKETKKAKQPKNEPTAEVIEKPAGATEAYFDSMGEKSQENKKNGGEEVKVSLTNKTLVRVKQDYGFFKAGHVQEFSDVALAIHEKGGMVFEKL